MALHTGPYPGAKLVLTACQNLYWVLADVRGSAGETDMRAGDFYKQTLYNSHNSRMVGNCIILRATQSQTLGQHSPKTLEE